MPLPLARRARFVAHCGSDRITCWCQGSQCIQDYSFMTRRTWAQPSRRISLLCAAQVHTDSLTAQLSTYTSDDWQYACVRDGCIQRQNTRCTFLCLCLNGAHQSRSAHTQHSASPLAPLGSARWEACHFSPECPSCAACLDDFPIKCIACCWRWQRCWPPHRPRPLCRLWPSAWPSKIRLPM